jgi:1-acyl-sn-glycerol-3-phosphate acyltransferase
MPAVIDEPERLEQPGPKATPRPRERVASRSPLRTPASGVAIPPLEAFREPEREEPSEPEIAYGDGDEGMLGAIPDFVSVQERARSSEIMIDFAPEPASEVASFTERPPPPPRAERSIEETIEDLHRAAHAEGDPGARQRAAQAFADIAERLGGPDAHARTTGRLRTGDVDVHDVDDFGLDRAYEARMRGLVDGLYDRWFRVMVRGAENVPHRGPALVVANHGGVLPWDGLMLRTAIARELAPQAPGRELRWLVEDSLFHAPFIGATANRLGAIRACPENAERLLGDGNLIAVFPEGDKGISKPFARRYELQRFGRGGYVKLALRMRSPIVPTAIIGAEEAHPMMFSTQRIAKLFGLNYLPFTATFPWLGPLGLLPLPSRWVILFGEPIDVSSEPASAAEDEVLVSRINDEVRESVQGLLRKALSLRPQPYGWSR